MATKPKALPPPTPPKTLEERVAALETGLWCTTANMSWLLAQTRHVCDCLFEALTRGACNRIPWEDLAPAPPDVLAERLGMGVDPTAAGERAAERHVPNRAERRQAGREAVKRMQGLGGIGQQ